MLASARLSTPLRRSVAVAVAAAALAAPAAAHASGTVTEFPTPTANAGPLGIASGPDGNVWFTEHSGTSPKPIGRIDPSGAITEFATEPGSVPDSITTGPDGSLWYTDPPLNKVGRITPDGVVTSFGGLGLISTHGIAAGPDGSLYVVDAGGNQIVEVKTDGTKVLATPIPTAASNPQQITAGPDGNMWFTEAGGSKIGRVNLTATPHTITEFDLGPNKGPRGIAVGPDGKIWFSESDAKTIGRMSVDGTGLQESGPTIAPTSDPEGLVAGRDGAMWIAIFNGRQIGRADAGLGLTQLTVAAPADMGPRFVAAGADGNVWFTDETHSAIGRITVDPPAPTTTTTATGAATTTATGTTTSASDHVRPVVSRLRLAPKTFVAGRARAKRPTGTTIRFTVSEAATARLTIERRTTSRRHRVRYVAVTKLTRRAAAGRNAVAFSGRIGRRTLRPGAYRVTVTARDAAGNATTHSVSARLTIARRG